MWNTVCSLVWQPIPSMVCQVVAADGPASAGTDGIGTLSGPSDPGGGAAVSVPSEDSGPKEAGLPGVADTAPDAVFDPDKPSPRPSPTPATTTTAPPQAASRSRRLRRCSAWRASCSARRLFSRELRSDTAISQSTGKLRTIYVRR